MTKLGFLRLSYEKQDTLLKLLILSMAAVLCKSIIPPTRNHFSPSKQIVNPLKLRPTEHHGVTLPLFRSFFHQAFLRLEIRERHP